MFEFENQVKEALKSNKIKGKKPENQNELAEILGITSPYLSDILKGNRLGAKYHRKIIESLNLDGDFNDLR